MPATVLLVHYNNVADTEACLASLAAAGAPDVLVVDNASRTGRIEEGVGRYPGRATLMRLEENVGFGRANNVGIREVLRRGGERVFVLNNDTLVEPDAMRHLERALDRHPEAALATPRILYADAPDTLWYGGGFVDWSRGTARTPGYNGPADAPLAMEPRPVTFASGCAMLLRAEALREVGGFDPRYFMYEEDVELGLRLLHAGWSMRYVPEAVVYHRVGGSQRGREEGPDATSPERIAFLAYHQTRNQLLTAARFARGADVLRFCWGFGLRRLALAAAALLEGRAGPGVAVARGVADAFAVVLRGGRQATSPAPPSLRATVETEASSSGFPNPTAR